MKKQQVSKKHRANLRRQHGEIRDWSAVVPFFANPRGVLVHRVKCAGTFVDAEGNSRHHAVYYFCGGSCCTHSVEGFTDKPEPAAVLCHRCEAMASNEQKPTADQLAGRHVHVGHARAVRTCCGGEGAKGSDS